MTTSAAKQSAHNEGCSIRMALDLCMNSKILIREKQEIHNKLETGARIDFLKKSHNDCFGIFHLELTPYRNRKYNRRLELPETLQSTEKNRRGALKQQTQLE